MTMISYEAWIELQKWAEQTVGYGVSLNSEQDFLAKSALSYAHVIKDTMQSKRCKSWT